MAKTKKKRLTKIQREVLSLLNDGHIMKIDRTNMASIGSRDVSPQTRYFLTENHHVTRKDNTKSVEKIGNGFIITEKGKRALLDPPPSKGSKRKSTSVFKNQKKCPRCENVKPISDFVNVYGYLNPRGKYCISCHKEMEREGIQASLEEEKLKIPKLKIIYGDDWKHRALPFDFEETLYYERDFCPYCGSKLGALYIWNNDGTEAERPNHIDHMDPLTLGGEDSIRNTLFCCKSCNAKKGSMSFEKWLGYLDQKYRKLSRKIYTDKHATRRQCKIGNVQ